MKILTDNKGIAIQDSKGRFKIDGEGEKVRFEKAIPGDSPVILTNFLFW